ALLEPLSCRSGKLLVQVTTDADQSGTVIVASSAWDFLETTFFSFLYLFFGRVFFGVEYRGSFILALVFLLLTIVVLACLGILSASFAMVFKRGDPFGIFLGAGSALFS